MLHGVGTFADGVEGAGAMDPRLTVISVDEGIGLGSGIFEPTMTYHYNDEEFGGVWARPAEQVLVFSDSAFASPFVYHDGPVGGVGTPVRLIFWGDWWLSDGVGQRDM